MKVPRFAFEKFPAADPTLTTTMKSVGEAMAIGRNFTSALQKALRSLEKRGSSFHWGDETPHAWRSCSTSIATPTDGRIVDVQQALRAGATVEQVFEATKIDPWFIDQIVLINEVAEQLRERRRSTPRPLRYAKDHGFSDAQIGELRGFGEAEVREVRHVLGVRPVYKTVDTCAGEFPALTPYHYSSYDLETEVVPSDRRKVVILGSGPEPHRAGRRVRLLLRARVVRAARRRVRDDHDQLQPRDGVDRLRHERPALLRAADARGRARGHPRRVRSRASWSASSCSSAARPRSGSRRAWRPPACRSSARRPTAIDLAEERGLFSGILDDAGLRRAAQRHRGRLRRRPSHVAEQIGYPVLVRPCYVLGGRGMEIVYDTASLADYFERIADQGIVGPSHPLLVDRFLDDAIEIDVDALYDGERLYIGGVMEHIEEAGIHSGDSSCTLPPVTLGRREIDRVREATLAIAEGIGVRGLLNVQFAIARRRPLRARGEPARLPHRARSCRRRSASRSRRRPRASWSARRSPS